MEQHLYYCLKKAHEGDSAAMEELIAKFHPLIKKCAARLNYECADTDLVITLIQLIYKVDPIRFKNGYDGQFIRFIATSLKNSEVKLYLKNKNEICGQPLDEEALEAFPSPHTADETEWLLLIKDFSREQQIILVKEFLYGYSDEDVSKSMKISRQAVHQAKNQALHRLKKILEGSDGRRH